MSGLVEQLQKEALDSSLPLADLLRKALVVARKLGIKDFEKWINCELNGYGSCDKIPEYRHVTGEIRAFNEYNGHWMPVFLQDAELIDKLTKQSISQDIGSLLALEGKSKNGKLCINCGQKIDSILSSMYDHGMSFRHSLLISANSIYTIFEGIRNTILEWSLKLEEEGIKGEGMSFSDEEKKKAEGNQNITIQNFQGILGDVSNSSISQTLKMQIKKGDVESLSHFLTENGISPDDIMKLEQALAEDPKPTEKKLGTKVSEWLGKMVAKAASGLLSISVGATGNLLSEAIMKYYGF